jgi:hypothetical protein
VLAPPDVSRDGQRLTLRDTMRTFDVAPDGKRIIFDRLRDNSDVVLIERRRPSER